MSADNFWLVTKNNSGKYEVYMRFASYDWFVESQEKLDEEIRLESPYQIFDTERELDSFLFDERNWTEYGVDERDIYGNGYCE